MSSTGQMLSGCLSLVGLGVYIATLVFVARVYNSSSKDPFTDLVIQNPIDYFKDFSEDIPDNLNEQKFKCQCEQGLFAGRCSEEQKNNFGCTDVMSQEQISNAINVVNFLDASKCNEYFKKIVNEKTKLNEVFNFNMNVVHLTSLLVLLFIVGIFAVMILMLIIPCFLVKCFMDDPTKITCFIFLVFIISLGLGIGNIAAFIILCINYYGGDSSAYGEFLECNNVRKEKFTNEFSSLEDLRNNFTTFMILNIIAVAINLVITCIGKICPPSPGMGD